MCRFLVRNLASSSLGKENWQVSYLKKHKILNKITKNLPNNNTTWKANSNINHLLKTGLRNKFTKLKQASNSILS